MNKDTERMLSRLKVTFAGIEFRSPIGVGPIGFPLGAKVTPEMHAEVLLKHAEAGAGYISTPGTLFQTEETIAKLRERGAIPSEFPPRISSKRFLRIETAEPPFGIEGLYTLFSPFMLNYEHCKMGYPDAEKLTKILVKKKPRDVRLIANIAGLGDFPETTVDTAKRWEELGADLLEVNYSCPMCGSNRGAVDDFISRKFPLRYVGVLVGDQIDLIEKITKEVVKAVNIPVGVKLSPETGFPRVVELARHLKDAGATWISTMNSAVGIAPPDIYNRARPLWPFSDGNPFVMASGPWLRMVCYKHVAAIAKFVPGMDISAIGGIFLPEHCIELMMLGSKLVGLCTGMLYKGRNLIRRCNEFIIKFMQEQGYETVEDFVGLGLEYIKPTEELELMEGKIIAEVDQSKCTECGICLDNICVAPYLEDGRVMIKAESCIGCGGCVAICPVNAIKLVLKE